jgi:hypothetical protein
MLRRALALAMAAALAGCGARQGEAASEHPPARATPAKTSASTASAPTSSASIAPARVTAAAGRPCGELECLAFQTSQAAFEHALAESPRIIALGEAHAQKDAPKVRSTARRFAEELLPGLAGRAENLVIELLTTNGSCEKAVERDVAERQKPVTEPQASTNQNQYLTLGSVAKRHGITPHALVPECEELVAVTKAGAGDIERLLLLIADATVRTTEKLVANGDPARAIVLYGGALHNDFVPRPGHEAWSYGPRLAKLVEGRYVEIDLVVPEFVRPAPPWQGLPWYAAFMALGPGSETILYRPSPSSYVLIFPRSAALPLEPPAQSP